MSDSVSRDALQRILNGQDRADAAPPSVPSPSRVPIGEAGFCRVLGPAPTTPRRLPIGDAGFCRVIRLEP